MESTVVKLSDNDYVPAAGEEPGYKVVKISDSEMEGAPPTFAQRAKETIGEAARGVGRVLTQPIDWARRKKQKLLRNLLDLVLSKKLLKNPYKNPNTP